MTIQRVLGSLALCVAFVLGLSVPAQGQVSDVRRELRQMEKKLQVNDFTGARTHVTRCWDLVAKIRNRDDQSRERKRVQDALARLELVEAMYWEVEAKKHTTRARKLVARGMTPRILQLVERELQRGAELAGKIRITKIGDRAKKNVAAAHDELVDAPRRKAEAEQKAKERAAQISLLRGKGEALVGKMEASLREHDFEGVVSLAKLLGEHLRTMRAYDPACGEPAASLEAQGMKLVAQARFGQREAELLAKLAASEAARASAEAEAAKIAAEKTEVTARANKAREEADAAKAAIEKLSAEKAKVDQDVVAAREAAAAAKAAAEEARKQGSEEAKRLEAELAQAKARVDETEKARADLEAKSKKAEAEAAERAKKLLTELEGVRKKADAALEAAKKAAAEAEARTEAAEQAGSAQAAKLQEELAGAQARLKTAEEERKAAAAASEKARAEAREVQKASEARAKKLAAELAALQKQADADLEAARKEAGEARKAAEAAEAGSAGAEALRARLEASEAKLAEAQKAREEAAQQAADAKRAAEEIREAAKAREAELTKQLGELEARAKEKAAERAALESAAREAAAKATLAAKEGSDQAEELKAQSAELSQKLEKVEAETEKIEAKATELEAERSVLSAEAPEGTGEKPADPATGEKPADPATGEKPAATEVDPLAESATALWKAALAKAGAIMSQAHALPKFQAAPGAIQGSAVVLEHVAEGVLDGGAMLASIDGDVYRCGDHIVVLRIDAELKTALADGAKAAGLTGPLGEATVLGRIVGATGVVTLDASGVPTPGSSQTVPLVEVDSVRFARLAAARGAGHSAGQ